MQVAVNFTNNRVDAEELVQDLYVSLLEMKDINKIKYGDTVNLFYLYKMIKSRYLNNLKKAKQATTVQIEEDIFTIEATEYNYELDEEFEVMLAKTKHLLESDIHWFDSRLLTTYLEEDHSIASLHVATGISKSSIWTSLTKTKRYIKESIDEV
jgi:DNA-directed RNA polymerase specialized sigma24 family protein